MMNWKRIGKKRLWPNLKALYRHSSGGTEENTKKLSQNSRYPGRDLNWGPPEYEAVVLSRHHNIH
jgi:hypothetical protein